MASALIVEDGTIVAGADTYHDWTAVEAHMDKFGLDRTLWDAGSDAAKDQWARLGSRATDLAFEERLKGRRVQETQSMLWPRFGVVDLDHFAVDSNVVPSGVVAASAELTHRFSQGDAILIDEAVGTNIKRESKKADVVAKTTEYFGPKMLEKYYTIVHLYMRPYITSGARVWRA